MADSKRLSMANPRSGNSTPKPTPAIPKTVSAAGPGELDFGKVIGARVKVTTTTPTATLEGVVFTACPITNLLAIKTSGSTASNQPADYSIIPISRIQSFTVTSLPAAPAAVNGAANSSVFENARPSIGRVDVKALQAREQTAIRKQREKDATRGKGVSQRAQDIFDALSRTLPARWDGQNIIVNDLVQIAPPYTSDDCRAAKDQTNNLNRVKRVLENELKKLNGKPEEKGHSARVESISKPAGSSRNPMVATPLPRKGG